jgi:hypothetical protein
MDLLFRAGNLLVLPIWALMILLPRWQWTARIMRSPLVSAAPSILYAGLVLPRVGAIWPAISRPTLPGVQALLGSPAGATIAWVHFLAFDLFVGRWIYLDSEERRISSWLMVPVLFLTLMLGPAGFLFYLVVRSTQAASPASAQKPVQSAAYCRETRSEDMKSFTGQGQVGSPQRRGLWRLLRSAFAVNPALTILAVTMLITFVATLLGIFVDHRVITGAPAWLKPAKFAISVSIYCFTFVWMLRFVENRPRLVRLLANVTTASLIVEMVVILTQAARGTTSHFNQTTTLNTALWFTMGAFIVLVWMMNLLLAVMLLLQRMPDRTFAWSLRLGLLISAIGMATAFFMVTPRPEQAARIAAGYGPHIVGAHSVGVRDGGPGLPVLGWSTVGGDLRVAHFVGLHALQVLPFLGWLLTRRKGVVALLSTSDRLALVWSAGVTYLGLILMLTWQALRGQSVAHPDTKTVAAAGSLAAGFVISVLITVLRVRNRNRRRKAFTLALQILSD